MIVAFIQSGETYVIADDNGKITNAWFTDKLNLEENHLLECTFQVLQPVSQAIKQEHKGFGI